MSEKIVKGIIERFSKIEVGVKNNDAKTPFAYVDVFLLDNCDGNRFFFGSAEEITEKLIERAPIGSTVEFKLIQKEKFWNVDKSSFKLLLEGDGTVPKSQNTNDPSSNALFVRQNALRHADEWFSTYQVELITGKEKPSMKEIEEAYFRFAEKCESWIMRD